MPNRIYRKGCRDIESVELKTDPKKAIHHEGHEDNEGKRIEYFMNCLNITDKLNAVIQRFQIQLMTKKYQNNGGTECSQ